MKVLEENKETVDYNSEPVYYCENCMSLNIKDMGFMDCCADCGETSIGTASLEEYDKIYYKRFGKRLFYPENN